MSSSLTKLVLPAPPTPPSRLLTPKTPTIPLLATSAARICNHAHAPLVLVYYVLRFSSLVGDPFNTMIRDLVPITITQCAFCAVCLPCAGTWGSGGSAIVSGTASGKSAKASSGSSSGSLRRKAGKAGPGALSSAFPVGAASWKSKVMVGKMWPSIPFFSPVGDANLLKYSPRSSRSSWHWPCLHSRSPSLPLS
jgi:GPI biosynthesis protein family Pig-F